MIFRQVKSKLTRSGEPEYFPVTLSEIKRLLDLGDTTDEDSKLEDLIPVAVEQVERHSQRALAQQTWELRMDAFPCGTIELRMPPVQSVTSITYLDTNGDSQTVDAADYETDLKSEPARIVPAEGAIWPGTACVPHAVTVTFVAGYPGPVPRAAWSAIMLALRALYYNCEVGESYQGFLDQLRWEGGL